MSDSLKENLVELALSIRVQSALTNLAKKNPEVMDTDGPRTALRNAIISAADALDAIEQADPELYESVDWYLVLDSLAGQIQSGALEPDLDAALKAGGAE